MTSHLRLDVGQGAAMWLQGEGIARKVTNKVCRIISKLENTIRDGDSTALYTVDTVCTVYTNQTDVLCLNSSMYASMQLGKVRTLLE